MLSFLAEHNRRVEVYLQFDGFRRETYLHHRNADLRAMKQRAIQRLSDAGIFTTLTMTTSLGVNDDEIGDVVLYALETPAGSRGHCNTSASFSDGDSPSRVCRGRRLRECAALSRSSWVSRLMSVPLGKY